MQRWQSFYLATSALKPATSRGFPLEDFELMRGIVFGRPRADLQRRLIKTYLEAQDWFNPILISTIPMLNAT